VTKDDLKVLQMKDLAGSPCTILLLEQEEKKEEMYAHTPRMLDCFKSYFQRIFMNFSETGMKASGH